MIRNQWSTNDADWMAKGRVWRRIESFAVLLAALAGVTLVSFGVFYSTVVPMMHDITARLTALLPH